MSKFTHKSIPKIIFSLMISLLLVITLSFSQNDAEKQEAEEPEVPPANKESNREMCLHCHAENHFTLYSADSSFTRKKKMFDALKINPEAYYGSNHKTFMCIDCHSPEYETYPHNLSARFEMHYRCLDCHYEDPNLPDINFTEIDKEYKESVHHKRLEDDFACWDCHDAHSYSLTARNNPNIDQIVAYDNEICLECHVGEGDFQMLTQRKQPEIIETHDWLPNQQTHFNKVRCIECHAQQSDSLMVAHNIRPKEEAVKRCEECHSQNSLLMGSLYKHQAKEYRQEGGFVNGVILNNAYVIGANRSPLLNAASMIIFILVVAGIAIHAMLRFRTHKKQT